MSPEGAQASLTLLVQDDPTHNKMAAILAADWAAIGIEVTLDARPYADLLANLNARSYETALVDIDMSNSSTLTPIRSGRIAGGDGANYAQWRNTTASEYLEQARTQPEIELRCAFTAISKSSSPKICRRCPCSIPFTTTNEEFHQKRVDRSHLRPCRPV